MDFNKIKKRSEKIIKKKKGKCNKFLPILDETKIREKDELVHRIAITFAICVIFTWPAHGLRFAAQCQRFLEMGKK
jgi:hypothetical protein